ncbi:hypothetical protein LXL04_010770 [Taraxacum kok-saghyz]
MIYLDFLFSVQLWKNNLQTVKVKLSNKRTQKLKTKEKQKFGTNLMLVETQRHTKLRRHHEFYENDVDDVMEKSELEAYIESPPEKLNSESFEILKWWSDKCTTYKVLSSMVKDILAVPVSTVASESAFSTSGRVVDDFRSNLGVKTVEAVTPHFFGYEFYNFNI